MPSWDFKCRECEGIQTEYFRSVEQADRAIVWCRKPTCVASRMARMPSAPSFVVGGFNAKNRYSKEGA